MGREFRNVNGFSARGAYRIGQELSVDCSGENMGRIKAVCVCLLLPATEFMYQPNLGANQIDESHDETTSNSMTMEESLLYGVDCQYGASMFFGPTKLTKWLSRADSLYIRVMRFGV